MPTFIDMSALTLKSSASGQEEIQVSESNKINTSQIAALTFAQNPNMGDLPINSRLKYVDNKTTLLGMLKMLTAAANIGRLRIVSGNPASGASGKPEMAFIVNIIQGTNAETQGTNGLQIFHLTNDYIRVIPSSSVAMAWPTLQTLTDEAIITKLHSTASGDWGGLGVTMEWAGSSSAMKYLTVTDFTRNTFSNGAIGDIAVGEMFTFTSAVDAANGPGSALVGYAVKVSALSVKYVGTSTSINTYRRSYLYTYQSTSIYATNWSIVGTPTGIEASVYEFTYGESEGVPTADLKFVKVADIFRMILSTPDQANYGQLDFIRSQDNDKTDQYVFVCPSVDTGSTQGGALQRIAVDATTGAVDMTGVSLAIKNQPAERIQVTNFNNPTNNVIKQLAVGQGVIICTTGSTVGGPSGVTAPLYGHCFRSSSGPIIYTYLLQTADGSRTFSGSTNGTAAQWTELGGGGVIMISDAESISKAVTSVTWKELGQIYPVIIYDPAGVAGLPADVPSNCTLVGNVQKVDDGTISSDDGYVVTLNVFQEDNFLSGIWYQILLNSAGEVLEEKKYDLSSSGSNEIFPGWKRIVSSWSSAVGPSGTSGVINFNQEIPTTAKILIEATIQSSHATTAVIKFPVPLTVAAINGTGQGILFEICSTYLGSNSVPGSIKLICSSVITGANGVQGMNVVVQSNNLSGISDIIQIKGIYFKA